MTRVAVQSWVTDLDVDANLAHLRERCAAIPTDVSVALFPEHFLTGTSPTNGCETWHSTPTAQNSLQCGR